MKRMWADSSISDKFRSRVGYRSRRHSSGFTIVELLIVIVIIAILAAITVVAYNGIQARARDAERVSDFNAMVKAVEMYKIETGYYPYHGNFVTNTVATATWAKTNLRGVNDGVLINPSAPSGTVNSWTSGGNGISSAQYSYYGINASLTACQSTELCVGYRMAWRNEAGTLFSKNVNP